MVGALIISIIFISLHAVFDPIHWFLPGLEQRPHPTTAVVDVNSTFHELSQDSQSGKSYSLGSDDSLDHVPYIPDKVWHSAKDDNLTEDQRKWIESWTQKNPSLRQELLTDHSGETFVQARFHNTRPDIVEVYEAIPIPILRADLLRYLIIFAEGGIWSDLDVTCDKEIVAWIPLEYQHQEIDMVVGLEFDFEWRGPGTQVASQFCNWVFMARPFSRNLKVIIDSVIDKVKEIAHTNNVPIEGITLDMLPDVVDVTGPKIMTIAILKALGHLLARTVDDRDFSGIKQPKLVGDVLIMPGKIHLLHPRMGIPLIKEMHW